MRPELLEKISLVTDEESRILRGEGGIDRSVYTHSLDFIVDHKHFLRPGMQIALRPHTRFTEFPLHGHNYVEIMYVVTGSVTHIVDGDEVVLRSGELLFLGAHSRHRVLSAKKEDVAFNLILTTEFFASFLDRMQGSEALSELIIESIRRDGKPGYLHFGVSGIPQVENILENLVYSLVGDLPAPEGILKETMALLLYYLVLYPETLLEGGVSDEKDGMIRRRILQYVQTEYRTASLTELSRRLGFSPQYVSEWIRRYMGTTFIALVQEKRFGIARQLLLNTDLPVGDIVSAVGYENSSYFHRCFRKMYGTTPHKIRGRQ